MTKDGVEQSLALEVGVLKNERKFIYICEYIYFIRNCESVIQLGDGWKRIYNLFVKLITNSAGCCFKILIYNKRLPCHSYEGWKNQGFSASFAV